MNYWDPNFDPYEAIKLCQHNIEQLVLAITDGSELMKEMARKHNHQQEVIQQLMFQNRRQQKTINQILVELELLKQRN